MLHEYDKAWAKYQNGLNTLALPLTCWEFYNFPRAEEKEFNNIQTLWSEKVNFAKTKKNQDLAILVTDANLKIVFASSNIMLMNGYDYKEITGKSPRMFQGELTSLESRKNIKIAVEKKLAFKQNVINYKNTTHQ